MKKIIFILAIALGFFSCQKEEIAPNSTYADSDGDGIETSIDPETSKEEPSEFVLISFNDVFDSGLDSVLVYENDSFVGKVAVGCGNTFKASLNEKYCFKKMYRDRIVPLFGNIETNVDTYVTFLTTSSKPEYCVDYVKDGLGVILFPTNPDDRCENVHYTFNAWF